MVRGLLWRGGLPPLGCEAVVIWSSRYIWKEKRGRFAAQRGQAPSPQSRGGDSPNAERLMHRVDPHELVFAVPGPAMAVHQVFALGAGVVGQAHFPQRQLEISLLDVMRIKADGHQNEVATVGATFTEIQNVVVPGVVELQPQMRL